MKLGKALNPTAVHLTTSGNIRWRRGGAGAETGRRPAC